MTTIASVHVADVGPVVAIRSLRGPRAVEGLRHADVAIAAPLRAAQGLARPMPGRAALVAFWDDHAALDRFLAGHPLARRFAGGWFARLEALRAFGDWPGLAADVPRGRTTPEHDGPVAVATLGRLRATQARRFLRTSRPAENRAVAAPGFLWGTALARPPFVATVSLWESATAAATYAYGGRERAHHDAIDEDRRAPFHRRSAFVRFRILEQEGALGRRNPLPASVTAALP